METLANLESFVRSADHGSFSEAARRLALTPAAVSRNVAMLERNLGTRLFHRSTRKLTLTEAGEAFRHAISENLSDIQAAIAGVTSAGASPSGILKVSMAPTFGTMHILPLLPAFIARYPGIRPEWHFENRQVDIIAEGYDASVGGGFDLVPGVVARALAPAHIIAVASPAYMAGRNLPANPPDLAQLDGIVMRSLQSGRIRHWTMRDSVGKEIPAPLKEAFVFNDPAAMRRSAVLGLGVAMLVMADVIDDLESGALIRLVPKWYADAGAISIYFASRTLLPGKTRAFVDFIVDAFKQGRMGERFAGSLG